VSFPAGLKYIGNDAFMGCSSLSGSLDLPENLETIEDLAFFGTNITSISIPSSLKYIGQE